MANPRKIAVNALLRVEQDSAYSNLIIGQMLSTTEISKEDKTLASAIFYGVLDRLITIDFYINKHSKIPAKKLQPLTRQVLRSGIYQLYYMNKIPQSAAVNESVKLIKQSSENKNSGFINAVLRAAINNRPELPAGHDLYSLSVRYSCPQWILKNIIDDYGAKETEKILSAFLNPSKLNIRVNTLKANKESLLVMLSKDGINAKESTLENSIEILGGIDFKNNFLFNSGYFHVQDISSQRCAEAVLPKPNDRILDLCAAPGGKSFTIAQLMDNKGELISCDLYENRVSLIEKGAKRLNISIIKAIKNDALLYNSSLGLFDKVLCDVPCSGFGVLGRKPEIKYKPINNFDNLCEIQLNILNTASKYVKNGGSLLYSTCTIRKAENECVVNAFLKENNNFKCEYMHTDLPNEIGDGFFRALLIKK